MYNFHNFWNFSGTRKDGVLRPFMHPNLVFFHVSGIKIYQFIVQTHSHITFVIMEAFFCAVFKEKWWCFVPFWVPKYGVELAITQDKHQFLFFHASCTKFSKFIVITHSCIFLSIVEPHSYMVFTNFEAFLDRFPWKICFEPHLGQEIRCLRPKTYTNFIFLMTIVITYLKW